MRESSVIGLSLAVVLALLLTGCGGRAQSDGGGAQAAAGSTNDGAAAGASGALEAAAGESGAGAAGEPGVPVTSLDISGRWGLFSWEDPVGVQLFQSAGMLSGTGCDVWARPSNTEIADDLCGAIAGTVAGNRAQFDFHFLPIAPAEQPADYMADVTVSADATRMTGRFRGLYDWLPYPTAWLRIPDGDAWLNSTPESRGLAHSGRYSLQLVQAEEGAVEYTKQSSYTLDFNGALAGDLGSFFSSEIGRPTSDGPIVVGPVAPTEPALAVQMSIDITGDVLSRVNAVTASGHHYTFDAVLTN